MFARFDENPAMTLQDIKKKKRYGRTQARTHTRTDNVKTVYPTTNKVCRGYEKVIKHCLLDTPAQESFLQVTVQTSRPYL